MRLRLEQYSSRLCSLLLVTDSEGALRALEFADRESRMHRLLQTHYGEYELRDGSAPKSVIKSLDAYFKGNMPALDDIRIASGGTPFQRSVWRILRAIEPGATKSYKQIAVELGRPEACRAVGAANGANPIAIIVACHRVIGTNGSLTGYAGGLERKQWLLDHERRYSFTETGANPRPNRTRRSA